MSTNGKSNGTGNGYDPDQDDDDNDNVIRIPSLAERDKMRREAEEQARKEYRAANPSEPMINLPPVTKYMLLALLIPHLVIEFLLSPPQQFWVMEHFGVIPAAYTVEFTGWQAIVSPFTYMFLHASWLHIGMNAAMLLAFGAGLERWMGGKRLFIFFYISSIAAVVFHFIVAPTSPYVVIGASGGISGLFAAAMIMLQSQGRMPLGKYGIWPFAAFWIMISFIFGLTGAPDGSNVAWAAHVGGFVFGLLFIKPFLKRF